MWRKSSEAKTNSASHTPAPAPAKPEEKPQVSSEPAAQISTATPQPTMQSGSPTASSGKPAGAGDTPRGSVTAQPNKSTVPASPARGAGAPEGASTISAGLKIKGEITGTSDLTVDGETQGRIRLTNGRVTVGPKGRVNDIDAREIVVYGTVQGNLRASESVRLGPSSHVEGSVLTQRISIDDGARLRGNVEMARAGEDIFTERPEGTRVTPAARAASASKSEE